MAKDKNNEEEKDDKSSGFKKWAMLSGIGFQMGATIFICAWAGRELDDYYDTEKNWFTIGLVLFGVFASIYLVLKQIKNLNK